MQHENTVSKIKRVWSGFYFAWRYSSGDCSFQYNYFTQKYKLNNNSTQKNPEMNGIEERNILSFSYWSCSELQSAEP